MRSVPASHVGTGAAGEASSATAAAVEDAGGRRSSGGGEGVDGKFRLALEHVHRVGLSLHSSSSSAPKSPGVAASPESPVDPEGAGKFLLKGGCPFKTFYRQKGAAGGGSGPRVPFVDAMESFSLGAIMAEAMAAAEEDEEKKKEEDEEARKKAAGSEMLKALAFDFGGDGGEKEAVIEAPTVAAEADAKTGGGDEDEVAPAEDDLEEDDDEEEEPATLSAALKDGTAESHAAAESVRFVADFVKGKIDRDLFARLTVALLRAYTALESELDRHGPSVFPALHHPRELARREALEDDVEFFYGDNWATLEECKLTPATKDYCDRIRFVAETEPLLLLSHAYTRYLGDLSGGRVLMRVARRALNLGGSDDGLRFYKFDNVSNPKSFKDAYRRELDGLDLDVEAVERLVAEANVAFVLNMRLFEELDVAGGVEGVSVRELKDATKYYDEVVEEQAERKRSGSGLRRKSSGLFSHGEGGDASKCPFAGMAAAAGTAEPAAAEDSSDEGETATETPSTAAAVVGKSLMTGTGVGGAGPPRQQAAAVAVAATKEGRCPWPFVFFHDPAAGLRDWQTWAAMGLIICWVWSWVKPAP